MPSRKRRQYTDEFKREAVHMVTGGGYSIKETARDLGINAKMLGSLETSSESIA